MVVTKDKIVTLVYELYVGGKDGAAEELMERATSEHPLIYCHGEGMMLEKFEQALEGLEANSSFDFCIDHADAYGEYDTDGVKQLPKEMFYNGDDEFDTERVYIGNIVPMTTTEGYIVNAQVVEITKDTVTIDLNHPLAGEDLHFKGSILNIREATEQELERIHNPHKCGSCHKHCGNKQTKCKSDCNGEHSCDCGQA